MQDKDINYYHNILKENINLIEQGHNNQQVINEIIASFKMMYEYIKMFLISEKEMYYGYFLINTKIEINLNKDMIIGVALDSCEVKFIVNPLLLGKYEIKEIIYIICHEIEHLVLCHNLDAIRLNPTKDKKVHEKLNIAMDVSVNDKLNHDIYLSKLKIMTPPIDSIDSIKLKKILNTPIRSLESYLYYFLLLKKDIENDYENYDLNYNEEKIVTLQNTKSKYIDLLEIDDDYEETREKIKCYVKNIVENIPEDIRGNFPFSQQDAINNILKEPKISWKKILKRFIGINLVPYKKTKLRLNRRQPERFDLSGRIYDRKNKIVIAIDTSASMTEKMLKYIFSEVFSILKFYKYELTIIECDAKIQKIYKIKNFNEVNYKVNGRGGTSFTPVIKYINNNNYYKDAILLYFTDGFGEESIPKPKTYKNLWIVFDDKRNLSLSKAYGEVITLNTTTDYHTKRLVF